MTTNSGAINLCRYPEENIARLQNSSHVRSERIGTCWVRGVHQSLEAVVLAVVLAVLITNHYW